MSGRLPELLDRKQLAAETGFGRATVDWVFGRLPVVALPGHRKVFVRREDVARLLTEHTYAGARVRP
jgi:hypothetical protein